MSSVGEAPGRSRVEGKRICTNERPFHFEIRQSFLRSTAQATNEDIVGLSNDELDHFRPFDRALMKWIDDHEDELLKESKPIQFLAYARGRREKMPRKDTVLSTKWVVLHATLLSCSSFTAHTTPPGHPSSMRIRYRHFWMIYARIRRIGTG